MFQYVSDTDKRWNAVLKSWQTIYNSSPQHIALSIYNDDHTLIHTFDIQSNVWIVQVYEIYMFYMDFSICISRHHSIPCTSTHIPCGWIGWLNLVMWHKLYNKPRSKLKLNLLLLTLRIKTRICLACAWLCRSRGSMKILLEKSKGRIFGLLGGLFTLRNVLCRLTCLGLSSRTHVGWKHWRRLGIFGRRNGWECLGYRDR